jgi:hypothetical protein
VVRLKRRRELEGLEEKKEFFTAKGSKEAKGE